jgi:UDP-N-acetylglucosamine--N-acetylmuramyl-(pentapeptide) pyrophosphoryl-undecaprenol N-acetylglucosamine transferase
MDRYFPKEKIFMTGNPVRLDMVNLTGKKERALEEFGLESGRPIALVMGGSLGARTINESVHAGLNNVCRAGVQLIWQTGKLYFETAQQAVSALGPQSGIYVTAFIARMDLAYAAADVVVSRAGAISISELCLVKKPIILVPSPNVAEDHQTRNAMALVNYQAALLVKDSEAQEKLIDEMIRVLKDPDLSTRLSVNIATLGRPNAADAIASVIFGLIKS